MNGKTMKDNTQITCSSCFAKSEINFWLDQGCSSEVLTQALGEHVDRIGEIGYRVPADIMNKALDAATRDLNDPMLGFKTGLHGSSLFMGLLGALVCVCRDARQAVIATLRFYDLLNQSLSFSFHEDDFGGYIRLSPKVGSTKHEASIDYTLGMFRSFIRAVDASANCIIYLKRDPNVVNFERYTEVATCSVTPSPTIDCLFIPKATLDKPISSWGDEVFERQLSIVQWVYDSTVGSSNIYDLALDRIRHACRFGDLSLQSIADQLLMTTRTFQNKLKEENTSYRKMVECVRRELVAQFIKEQEYDPNLIAIKAGYPTTTAFKKCFSRWKNTSFADYIDQTEKNSTQDTCEKHPAKPSVLAS